MNGKWLGVVILMAGAAVLMSLASCGHDQQLVSIQVQPGVETFGASNIQVIFDAGLQVQLRALGTYIHPPVVKDITNQVTWLSNDTQMFSVTNGGLLTATGGACGGTLVSATVKTNTSEGGISSSGAIVTGYMTANVVCFTGTGGAGGPALGLTFGGQGAGNVSSAPPGLSCTSAAGVCASEFPLGTVVTLTATPTPPSTFGSWTGCSTANNVNPCMVTLEGNTFVTVTFN